MIKLINDDCLKALQELPENSIDTCITDPPYGLGFMGKEWDNAGVSFQPSTWQAVYRVLKPGGLLLSFGGTRTYHRIVCAIEDAGFEIRDCVMWVYGSGFPKSYNVAKGIEAQIKTGKSSPTAQRITAMGEDYQMTPLAGTPGYGYTGNFSNKDTGSKPMEITTPEAQLWGGWGTQLKPAYEPIVIAQKPLDGTYAENALKWGVAGYWIDGGRIPSDEPITINRLENWSGFGEEKCPKYEQESNNLGRFPSNLIHDGSDEVISLFPEGAQRFFYQSKASRSERNAGLEGMPTSRMGMNFGGELSGHGKPINIKPHANTHPTVKPIELMRYLVRLTKTPTGGVVLDPFMGSGTTGCACVLENRDFIGIEKEAEYIEIAQKRIGYYQTPLEKFANGNENYD